MSKETKLHKINKNENDLHVEAYHAIMKAANNFSMLSPNIPKAFLEVQQHIHGAFDNAAYYTYKAEKEKDTNLKLEYLNIAKDSLYFQYSRLEYLVKTKALTIGGVNTVIDELSNCYEQICKWYNYINKYN